ncbi:MAG: hypothetical protein BWY74_01909 [Firmicutes bacterium ADurb.Bin419]|nr:MAG: hypothetical protein BWY74_01909 [Firmicutes bacterium ADurb.Bin419]
MFFNVIFVHSIVGFCIPLILLCSLVISPLKMHYYRKKKGIVVAKNKGGKISELILAMFFIFGILALSTWSIYIVIPFYRDIPTLITGKYNTANGVVNGLSYASRSGKSWGYDVVTIDGKTYKFTKITIPQINSRVTITYLPYTRIIKSIEQDD